MPVLVFPQAAVLQSLEHILWCKLVIHCKYFVIRLLISVQYIDNIIITQVLFVNDLVASFSHRYRGWQTAVRHIYV